MKRRSRTSSSESILSEKVANQHQAKERIEKLFRFLQELHKVRTPPKQDVRDYDWALRLSDLPQHPTIEIGKPPLRDESVENESESFLLRVARPNETHCPEPPPELKNWIENTWNSLDSSGEHLQAINTVDEEGLTSTIQFDAELQRVRLYKEWKERRERWIEAEKPVRAAGFVYSNLYKLLGQIERESEKYQLYLGDGILRWNSATGPISHPLLLLRINIEFDSRIPQFTISASDSDVELYVSLLRFAQIDGRGILRCKEKIATELPHPYDSERQNAVLQYIAQTLFEDGQFFSDESDAQTCQSPHLIKQPTFFLGLRNQGFIDALDAFIDQLKYMAELPEALVRVVGVESQTSAEMGEQTSEDRGVSNPETTVSDYLLTKAANKEQERIIDRLEEAGTVLVQGPPGTGKSHTIANLIGHLLAQKKTILVTSHAAKALKVVREKVVDALQPLCVSVLDNDEESKSQLEESITGIVNYLSRTDAKKLKSKISDLASKRDFLKKRVRTLTDHLLTARRHEYTDIVVSGEAIAPARAARQIAEMNGVHDWIPGPVEFGLACPLSPAELAELYASNNEMTKAEEVILARPLPEIGRLPDSNSFFDFAGEKKSLIANSVEVLAESWLHQNQVMSDLAQIKVDLQRTLSIFEKKEQWIWECVDAGRIGAAHRERWTSLRNHIQESAQKIAELQNTVLEIGPSIDSAGKEIKHLLKISEEILSHVRNGGKLNFISTAFKSDWKDFLKRSSVNGNSPTTVAHFTALNSLLAVLSRRDDLVGRWQRQMSPLGAVSADQLGGEPERALTAYLKHIDDAINWFALVWKPVESKLVTIGLNVSKLISDASIDNDKYAELSKLKLISQAVLSLIEQRTTELRIAELEKIENDWLSELNGFSRSEPVFEVVEQIRDSILTLDHLTYSGAWKRLNSLYTLKARFHRRCDLITKLEGGAPGWASAIRNRVTPHDGNSVPGNTDLAWKFIQWDSILNDRYSSDLDAIQAELNDAQKDLQDVTAQYVERLAWLAQIERTGLKQQQALTGWLGIQKRMTKTGRGVRDARLRREAKELIKECKNAVPVWIMPESRAFESFDLAKTRFDVVIIDEASQSGVDALAALALGNEVVVVGDHEQVSPYGAGVKLAPVQALIDELLTGVPNSQLYDGKLSLYDIARQSFGGTIRLIEHFRCVPDIIQFSNHLSYEGDIKPLREASSSPFSEHVICHRVEGIAADNKVNEVEAKEIASIVAAMVENPEYENSSIGVVTLRGLEQALHIDSILQRSLGPTAYKKHKILCGNASQFQGDERNVMLLSMVDSCENPPLAIQQAEEYKRSFNVAASRAKDQMWLVHSLNPSTDLKPNDLRLRLIQHMQDPTALRNQLYTGETKVDSEFERLVLHDLTNEGFRIVCQWKVGAYRIDLVAVGSNKKIAIECDGDRYHPPEKLADDLARQMVLERLGWRFIRIRGGEYFRDRKSSINKVIKRFDEIGIERLGPESTIVEANTTQSELKAKILSRASEIRSTWSESAAIFSEGEELSYRPEKKWGRSSPKKKEPLFSKKIVRTSSEDGSAARKRDIQPDPRIDYHKQLEEKYAHPSHREIPSVSEPVAVPRLSKSQYCKGRKCLKRVWLYNHHRELAQAPGEFQQQLFDQGHEVGKLACTLYPEGILIHEDHRQKEAALEHTKLVLQQGTKVIFEGAFLHENIIVRVDILKVRDDGSVDLIEVKSTNSVKKEHLDDVAVQRYVLEGSGLKVNECFVMHLNPEYVKNGDLNLSLLFQQESVSMAIQDKVKEVADYVELIRANLVLGQEPSADIGTVCKNPYKCEFYEYCWSHVTNDSIHILTRISAKKRIALTEQSIESIKDIPESFELTENQMVQRKCAITGDSHIELRKIDDQLKSLRWPLYFVDFETIQYAIPQMDGTSPYQHLTFQYSLHVQETPGGPIVHKEHLNSENVDPRRKFANQLCLDIPMDGGSVIVYYAPFERSKLQELRQAFSDLDHHISDICDRLWDLETPFSKRWYYEHSFGGRSSIKVVLPALVPELSYKDLVIQRGDMAQTKYIELISTLDPTLKLEITNQLRAYCKLDTWAMVQILRVLMEISGKSGMLPKAA